MTDDPIFLGLAALGTGIAFAGWQIGLAIRTAADKAYLSVHEVERTALTITSELVRASRHARKSHVFASQRLAGHLGMAVSQTNATIREATRQRAADALHLHAFAEVAASEIRRGMKSIADAQKFDARVRSGIVHRKIKLAERSDEEKLVDRFMDDSGKALTDDEKLEIEWAYVRLRGHDRDQGSISKALGALRKYDAPLPPDITPDMIESMLVTDDEEA